MRGGSLRAAHICAVLGLCLAAPLRAAPEDRLVEGYFADLERFHEVIASDETLLRPIFAANIANDDLDDAAIAELDRRWVEGDEQLQASVRINVLSQFLKAEVEAAGGRIGELIVMDDRGLTVAAWPLTSDYLQGDEDKYLETYARGAEARHVARVDFDDSAGVFQQQVSRTLTLRGRRIGAITLGINIAYNP